MSWLIEAYFEEGKHGPDHPESLNMKNVKDMQRKHKNERLDNEYEKEKDSKLDRIDGPHSALRRHDDIYEKSYNSKEAKQKELEPILKGDERDTEARRKYAYKDAAEKIKKQAKKERETGRDPLKTDKNEEAQKTLSNKHEKLQAKDKEHYNSGLTDPEIEKYNKAKNSVSAIKAYRRHSEKKAVNEALDMIL